MQRQYPLVLFTQYPLSHSIHWKPSLKRIAFPGCALCGPLGTALLCCLWSSWGHKVPRDKRHKAQVGFLGAFTHLAALWAAVDHLYPNEEIIWTAENWAAKSNSEAEWQSTESKDLAHKWIPFNLAFSFSFFSLLLDYFPNQTSVLGSSASRLFGT